MPAAKRVAILGSTGSIGRQGLDVVAAHPDRFRVVALAAGSRVEDLLAQARRFRPQIVSCAREADAAALRGQLSSEIRVLAGAAGMRAVATESEPDVVLAATDGAVAFEAVFAAVARGTTIAIANKELVVAAGELLFAAAAASGARLLPVDSEHSALFQCLVGEPPGRVHSLVLTASGGPFRTTDAATMRRATVHEALRHPTWTMGVKNTVDSASMMNKGLEVIEASRFFDMPAECIEVLVHPTSIVHGFVVFTDGNVKAQLAPPDMRLPIGYALAYPDRLPSPAPVDALAALGGKPTETTATLAFERPDLERFPCLRLAYDSLRRGGIAPAVLSAANEIAVEAFVAGRILFGEIAEIVEETLRAISDSSLTLEHVRAADARARALAAGLVHGRLAAEPELTASAARGR